MTADRRARTNGASAPGAGATPDHPAAAWEGSVPRMRDVRHVHGDHDPRAWHWFARGPLVAADGGEPSADESDRPRDRDVEEEQLRDVSHEPPHGDGANRVWDRGDDEDESE